MTHIYIVTTIKYYRVSTDTKLNAIANQWSIPLTEKKDYNSDWEEKWLFAVWLKGASCASIG